MIKVYFSPQRADNQIEYSFCGEMVTARMDEIEDTFDFSNLPDGELDRREDTQIKTILPVNPVISAKRIDGLLYLELLNWIGKDAPYESRFPEWVELPLPEKVENGDDAEEPKHEVTIPWRSKEEIDAERRAVELAAQESEERRARIKAAFNNSLLKSGGVDLRDVLRDMAMEMGLIN